MAYVRIWVHLVFGTKSHVPFLTRDVKNKVIAHIIDNARNKEIFIDCINGNADHLHCLISLGSEQNIAKVVNLIKGESSYWINKNKITSSKFEWAEDHHKKKSFADEHTEFIKKYSFDRK
ncbi:MAG: transposase [Bacteroidota bacterium]|nr:transposase [Bacteroidota bacterium]